MNNLTLQELREMADDDRAESASSFANDSRIDRYFNRCVMKIIRTPGVRTVKDSQTISFTGSGSYTLNADVKDVVELISGGAGTTNSVQFQYLPPDEYDKVVTGFVWTIKQKGKIEIFATDSNQLPTTSLTLLYWSKNIILDTDGTTKKAKWENDGDTSRLPAEYDEMYINFADTKIKLREGKRKAAADSQGMFNEALDSLIVFGGEPKPVRQSKSFGHYQAR